MNRFLVVLSISIRLTSVSFAEEDMGYKDFSQLETWASSSLLGGGHAGSLKLGNRVVYYTDRSFSKGGSTSELIFYIKEFDRIRPFLEVPLQLKELKVSVVDGKILVKCYAPETKSWVAAMTITRWMLPMSTFKAKQGGADWPATAAESKSEDTAKRLFPDKWDWEYFELPNGREIKLYPVPAPQILPQSYHLYSIKDKDTGRAYFVSVYQNGYSWVARISKESDDIFLYENITGISLDDCFHRIRKKYKLKGKFSDITQAMYSSPATSKGELIYALQSRHRNATDIALKTLVRNEIAVPKLDLANPYSEVEPALQKLVEKLQALPASRLNELDDSLNYYRRSYSPAWPAGGEGWVN